MDGVSEDVGSDDDNCDAADTARPSRFLIGVNCGCRRAKDRARSRLPLPGTLMTGTFRTHFARTMILNILRYGGFIRILPGELRKFSSDSRSHESSLRHSAE